MADLQHEAPAPTRRAPDRAAGVARATASAAAAGAVGHRPSGSTNRRGADVLQVQLQRAVSQRAAAAVPTDPLSIAAPARPADVSGRLQRSFEHQGKKRIAATIGKGADLPRIQGAKEADLRKLADDDHDYGALESKDDVDAALVTYATKHPVVVTKTPLEEQQGGNVTVLDVPNFRRNARATFQLDWLQGKHDQPFMREHSSLKPRKSDGSQMRLTLDQYAALARGVPSQLTGERMTKILAKPEEVALDFSVMDSKQSDGYYYEISAKWQNLGGVRRHVLVYYHCFPEK
jgi:hypothetical protein